LALIRQYGGVYMDSTILLFEPLDLNHWGPVSLPEDHPDKKAIITYYYDYFSLPDRHDGLEIWMVIAAANEILIQKWHDLYLKLYEESDGPEPLICNKTTHEQNKLFEGVDFTPVPQGYLVYGVSTACLHALLQLEPAMNNRYHNKSILYDAELHAYKVNFELHVRPWRLYLFLFTRWYCNWSNTHKMIDGIPLQKLVNHAFYASDELYDEWRDLRNNFGFSRLIVLERAKLWRAAREWDYSDFRLLRI